MKFTRKTQTKKEKKNLKKRQAIVTKIKNLRFVIKPNRAVESKMVQGKTARKRRGKQKTSQK